MGAGLPEQACWPTAQHPVGMCWISPVGRTANAHRRPGQAAEPMWLGPDYLARSMLRNPPESGTDGLYSTDGM